MSDFDVRGPLRNAIIKEDFLHQFAYDIYEYLSNCNNHNNKKYILLNKEINSKQIGMSIRKL